MKRVKTRTEEETKNMNRIQKALAESTDTEVAELLAPLFESIGSTSKVRSFASLKVELETLAAFKKAHMKESEDRRKMQEEQAERTGAMNTLKDAGVLVESIEDPRVAAYIALSEGARTEFVKSLQTGPKSAARVPVKGKEDEKGELNESEKKALDAAFGLQS